MKQYCFISIAELCTENSCKMDLPFSTELYEKLQCTWPLTGKIILHSPNIHLKDDTIILYQAYKETIAKYGVAHQTFKNCPDFSTARMTWLKPNFLWMMYRSGWATKPNQERILAITVKKDNFNEILRKSVTTLKKENATETKDEKSAIDVRLQWDPDHDPFGEKLERRAIQIGIRGDVLEMFLSQHILSICDITDFVQEQRSYVSPEGIKFLRIPAEHIYTIDDDLLRSHISLDFNHLNLQK